MIIMSGCRNKIESPSEETPVLASTIERISYTAHDFHIWYLGFYNFAQLVFKQS